MTPCRPGFTGAVSLTEHQRAADYESARLIALQSTELAALREPYIETCTDLSGTD